MQISGPYSSRGDTEVEELRINGPATIKHHIIVEDDTQISGPCGISGTLECGGNLKIKGPLTMKEGAVVAEEIKIMGPLTVNKGTVRSKSRLDIRGPLTNNDGMIACDELDIKGPLTVKEEGRITANDVNVSGPLHSDSSLSFKDVRISGPLRCRDNFNGRSIKISGPINVDGSLTATERIDVYLGWGRYSDETLIDCDFIQAPEIRISGRSPIGASDSTFGRGMREPPLIVEALVNLADTVLNILSPERRGEPPFIDVDLKGEKIVLRSIHHRGRVEGELILEKGATHED